jgi:hypothetical protein
MQHRIDRAGLARILYVQSYELISVLYRTKNNQSELIGSEKQMVPPRSAITPEKELCFFDFARNNVENGTHNPDMNFLLSVMVTQRLEEFWAS